MFPKHLVVATLLPFKIFLILLRFTLNQPLKILVLLLTLIEAQRNIETISEEKKVLPLGIEFTLPVPTDGLNQNFESLVVTITQEGSLGFLLDFNLRAIPKQISAYDSYPADFIPSRIKPDSKMKFVYSLSPNKKLPSALIDETLIFGDNSIFGPQLVNITNFSSPKLIHNLFEDINITFCCTENMAQEDNFIYLTAISFVKDPSEKEKKSNTQKNQLGRALFVIEKVNNDLRILNHYHIDNKAPITDLAAHKGYVFLNANALIILDASNPFNITQINQSILPSPQSFKLNSHLLYIATFNLNQSFLHLINISDPNHFASVADYESEIKIDQFEVDPSGKKLIICDGLGKLELVDFSNLKSPKRIITQNVYFLEHYFMIWRDPNLFCFISYAFDTLENFESKFFPARTLLTCHDLLNSNSFEPYSNLKGEPREGKFLNQNLILITYANSFSGNGFEIIDLTANWEISFRGKKHLDAFNVTMTIDNGSILRKVHQPILFFNLPASLESKKKFYVAHAGKSLAFSLYERDYTSESLPITAVNAISLPKFITLGSTNIENRQLKFVKNYNVTDLDHFASIDYIVSQPEESHEIDKLILGRKLEKARKGDNNINPIAFLDINYLNEIKLSQPFNDPPYMIGLAFSRGFLYSLNYDFSKTQLRLYIRNINHPLVSKTYLQTIPIPDLEENGLFFTKDAERFFLLTKENAILMINNKNILSPDQCQTIKPIPSSVVSLAIRSNVMNKNDAIYTVSPIEGIHCYLYICDERKNLNRFSSVLDENQNELIKGKQLLFREEESIIAYLITENSLKVYNASHLFKWRLIDSFSMEHPTKIEVVGNDIFVLSHDTFFWFDHYQRLLLVKKMQIENVDKINSKMKNFLVVKDSIFISWDKRGLTLLKKQFNLLNFIGVPQNDDVGLIQFNVKAINYYGTKEETISIKVKSKPAFKPNRLNDILVKPGDYFVKNLTEQDIIDLENDPVQILDFECKDLPQCPQWIEQERLQQPLQHQFLKSMHFENTTVADVTFTFDKSAAIVLYNHGSNFFNTQSGGMKVINFQKSENDTTLTTYDTDKISPFAASVDENFIYLGGIGGLETLALVDERIIRLDRYPLPACYKIIAQDNYLYVAGGNQGILIFKINSEGLIECLNRLLTLGAAIDLYLKDEVLYVADFNRGFTVFDVSSPKEPKTLTNMTISNQASNILGSGNLLFVTYGNRELSPSLPYAGVKIFDIIDPNHPQLISDIKSEAGLVNDVLCYKNKLFLVTQGDIFIYDFIDPRDPTKIDSIRFYEMNHINYKAVIHEGILLVSYQEKLNKFNLENVKKRKWLQRGGVNIFSVKVPENTVQLRVLPPNYLHTRLKMFSPLVNIYGNVQRESFEIIVNQRPNILPLPEFIFNVGERSNYQLDDYVIDEDKDPIHYDFPGINGSRIGTWLSVYETGELIGEPAFKDGGMYGLEVIAEDSYQGQTQFSIDLVVNRGPQINESEAMRVSNQYLVTEEGFRLKLDIERLFYSLDSHRGLYYCKTDCLRRVDSGLLPSWLSFNASDGTLLLHPGKKDVGELRLSLQAVDEYKMKSQGLTVGFHIMLPSETFDNVMTIVFSVLSFLVLSMVSFFIWRRQMRAQLKALNDLGYNLREMNSLLTGIENKDVYVSECVDPICEPDWLAALFKREKMEVMITNFKSAESKQHAMRILVPYINSILSISLLQIDIKKIKSKGNIQNRLEYEISLKYYEGSYDQGSFNINDENVRIDTVLKEKLNQSISYSKENRIENRERSALPFRFKINQMEMLTKDRYKGVSLIELVGSLSQWEAISKQKGRLGFKLLAFNGKNYRDLENLNEAAVLKDKYLGYLKYQQIQKAEETQIKRIEEKNSQNSGNAFAFFQRHRAESDPPGISYPSSSRRINKLSSSHSPLLRSSPLRTQRASFLALRSSLDKAII